MSKQPEAGESTCEPDGEAAALDELARRYLDLWQDQVSALAADEELAEAMGRLLGAFGAGGMGPAASGALQPWLMWPAMAAQMWGGGTGVAPGARETAEDDKRQVGREDGAGSASGAAAAAAAPGQRDRDLDELAGRIAVLERRIAELEGAAAQGAAGQRRRAAGGARKRRS